MESKSSIITDDVDADDLPLVTPGEVLLEEFLAPFELSQYRLAQELKVPPRRINEIVRGTRAITPDTALRLARYFGTSAKFWLALQVGYELRAEGRRSGERIAREVQPRAAER